MRAITHRSCPQAAWNGISNGKTTLFHIGNATLHKSPRRGASEISSENNNIAHRFNDKCQNIVSNLVSFSTSQHKVKPSTLKPFRPPGGAPKKNTPNLIQR